MEYVDTPSRLNVLSTETYRTLQSGYSEVMGMLGKKHDLTLTPRQVTKLPTTFKVRRAF